MLTIVSAICYRTFVNASKSLLLLYTNRVKYVRVEAVEMGDSVAGCKGLMGK